MGAAPASSAAAGTFVLVEQTDQGNGTYLGAQRPPAAQVDFRPLGLQPRGLGMSVNAGVAGLPRGPRRKEAPSTRPLVAVGLHMQVSRRGCWCLSGLAVLRGDGDEEAPSWLDDRRRGDRRGSGGVFRLHRYHASCIGLATYGRGSPPGAHCLCDRPRRPWPYPQAGAAYPRTCCAQLR